MGKYILIVIILLLVRPILTNAFDPIPLIKHYFIAPLIVGGIISMVARVIGLMFKNKLNSICNYNNLP